MTRRIIYRSRREGRLEISADLVEASAPILYRYRDWNDDPEAWDNLPIQTADARHDRRAAVRMAREFLGDIAR